MKARLKKFKFFLTFHKEREWLENMALQGYMLEDVKLGMFYCFRKDEPKRMLYEVDRFDLKRNPNLEEMMEKKNFIDMATEGGWREVTHDESLTYYFTKEYEEDGFNDLYNDDESIQIRADKFRNIYMSQAKLMVKMVAFIAIVQFVVDWLLIKGYLGTTTELAAKWKLYHAFCAIYVIGTTLLACAYFKLSEVMYEDMRMMSGEAYRLKRNKEIRKEKKLIMTTKGLQKYLKKHAQKGEKLISMGMFTYTFEKTESMAVDFVMDTKSMVNERRKKAGMKAISDAKDWNLMGNDWQAESIAYASQHGLECLCALDNRAIIYQVYNETDIPEDMAKSRMRVFSILGGTGTLMLIGGIIGFVIGMLSAMFKL